jgi:D-alanine-D-alanine ligase
MPAVKEDGMIRTSRRLRICVLAGGDSAERLVSLASGRGVARALAAAGHRVTCIDPQPTDSPLKEGTGSERSFRIFQAFASPRGAGPLYQRAAGVAEGDYEFRPAPWQQIDWRQFDACFLALHGGAGEDGRLQEFLQQRGVAFTGPPARAARTAMSKIASKDRFRQAGVATPDYRAFHRGTPLAEIAALAGAIGYPLIVKPDAQGSSLGVVLVAAARQLAGGIDESLRYDAVGLLETFVPGREFTLAVLGREPLPLMEVCCRGPIFSYAEKYDSNAPHYRFDTGLPPAQQRSIEEAAVDAARALETEGLVRVDLRLDEAGRPWVLELNATPGMTESSLAPAAARRAGLEMPELCDILLGECLQRRKIA